MIFVFIQKFEAILVKNKKQKAKGKRQKKKKQTATTANKEGEKIN